MKSPDSQNPELSRLVSRACDGLLDEADEQRLAAMLAADSQLRDQYVSLVTNEALLELEIVRPRLAENAQVDHDRIDGGTSGGGHDLKPHGSQQRQTDVSRDGAEPTQFRTNDLSGLGGRFRRWRRSQFAIAASALVVTGFAAWTVIASRGGRLATVVAVEEVEWSSESRFETGDELGQHWLEIESGIVQLATDRSALVTVYGPSRFCCRPGNSAELTAGSIAVHVPPEAHGFTVEAPELRVQDLGTGFTLRAREDGANLIRVTDGAVRVQRISGGPAVTMRAGQALTASAADRQSPLQPVEAIRGRLRVSGQFRVATTNPPSLAMNAFEDNRWAYIFLESEQRVFPLDLPVNLQESGRYNNFNGEGGVVEAGSAVDCYLIHFDPASGSQNVAGTVKFPGEILGVITSHEGLNATNETLGAGWALRCSYMHRGLEDFPAMNADEVNVWPDRRTLTVRFSTAAIDQLRVLVKPLAQ